MAQVPLTIAEQLLLGSLVFIFEQTSDGDCFAIFPKAFWNQHHRDSGEEDPDRDDVLAKLGFERLTETDFDRPFHYATSKGEPTATPFAATLAHVFNHATHHRGQITAALTMMGHPSPVLDLVYMLRDPAQAASRS